MEHLLSDPQKAKYAEFREFASSHIAPFAEDWDREQEYPASTISVLAGSGYLGALLPPEYGGKGWDTVTFGLLNEAFARDSSSLTGLVTVQAMVSMTLLKWGTEEQRRRWIPCLANGELIGAFALTEPGAGSAIQSLATEFEQSGRGDGYILNGRKKWISYGQAAGMFLVFGKVGRRPMACVVPRDAEGIEIRPIRDLLGFRAAGLAEIDFQDVEIPPENVIGKPGFGVSLVAPVGLQYGRISTACAATGLLRGCFEESIAYAATRKIAARAVGDIGMIRTLITGMGADLRAASLLWYSACRAADEHLPEAFEKTLVAKYFCSRASVRAAADAVQIRGASGCHGSAPVARYYRDAKVTEIIEGTSQIHEHILGKMFVDKARKVGA